MLDNMEKDDVFDDILDSRPEKMIELKAVSEFTGTNKSDSNNLEVFNSDDLPSDAIYINLRREMINNINDLICKSFNMILRTLIEKAGLNNKMYHIRFNISIEYTQNLTFNFVETTKEFLEKYYSLLEIPEIKNKYNDIIIVEVLHKYRGETYGYSFYLEKQKN